MSIGNIESAAKITNKLVLLKKGQNITFVIKNTVVLDSGFYRLQIRREGYVNLYSRIEIRVKIKPGMYKRT